MSGHSKWASIKHKKAQVDARKASIFTRIANQVTIAARSGGDPLFNPALRTAIDAARAVNMPKDNVDRAVKRGTGELGGVAPEELLYEGFGPAGVCILVAALSDNRNRTAPEIRTILAKHGGRIADEGSVSYQFSRRGLLRLTVAADRIAALEVAVIEGGAEDYIISDDQVIVYTEVAVVNQVNDALRDAGFTTEESSIAWVAKNPIELEDEQQYEKVMTLVELLEDHPDVSAVYTNLAE
jgi:YebC/PmpR family DNA-binding regulatory protein